jgi:TRAP transporter 4TM/12TM fusion protein
MQRLKEYLKINRKELGIKNTIDLIVFIIGLVFIFVLHWVNSPNLPYSGLKPWANMSLPLCAAVVIVFLKYPFSKSNPVLRWIVDGSLIGITIFVYWYMILTSETIHLRLGFPDLMDLIVYPPGCAVVLEATRRTTGLPLVLVALAFIGYAHFGHLIPGHFRHSYLDFARVSDGIFLGIDGLFGRTTDIMVRIIWYFIAFGAFLEVTGAGKAFMDFATALGGSRQGGTAQTAVTSSALFGTISGSGVANVVTTGSFTIPLMKSTGYKPHFAGAVEAAASMGGQIMPPVMGSGVFLMSGITGIAYIAICKAAVIPAIYYFLCIFLCVYFEAGRLGLKGLPKDQVPSLFDLDVLARSAIPLSAIFAIVAILILGRTPRMAAAGAIVWLIGISFIVSFFKADIRMNLSLLLRGLSQGFVAGAGLAAILATAGICVGVIYFTGIGMKFSNLVLSIGETNLLLALISLMIAALFLGMGLPTPAAYLILAIMAGPALKKLGVPLLSSHLLIFYYAVFAGLTPPVGIAYMIAAGIAKAGQLETGLTAFFRLALVGVIMPFLWIYKPGVLLQGSIPVVIWTILCTLVGVWTLSMCLIGYWKRYLHWAHRMFALSLWLLFAPIRYQVLLLPAVILVCLYNKYGFSIFKGKPIAVGSASEPKRVPK